MSSKVGLAVEIKAAVIGATAQAISTASNIANEAIQRSKSNLAVSIEVWNGTAYDFVVSKTKFRQGAFLGGTEGTFIEVPGQLSQQSYNVFSVEQVKGATTDVIGAVLFTSKVMDLLVGFHIYDQFGIQRYITAIPLEKNTGKDLFEGTWGANLDHPLNEYIWSGAGPKKSKSTTKNTMCNMFNHNGSFIRDVRERDENGDLVATVSGDPSIRQIDSQGAPSFATLFTGSGQIMKATVSDDAFIDEIIDITGDWVSEHGNVEFYATFVPEGIKISSGSSYETLERDQESGNKYYFGKDLYEFLPKVATHYDENGEVVNKFHKGSGG